MAVHRQVRGKGVLGPTQGRHFRGQHPSRRPPLRRTGRRSVHWSALPSFEIAVQSAAARTVVPPSAPLRAGGGAAGARGFEPPAGRVGEGGSGKRGSDQHRGAGYAAWEAVAFPGSTPAAPDSVMAASGGPAVHSAGVGAAHDPCATHTSLHSSTLLVPSCVSFSSVSSVAFSGGLGGGLVFDFK